MKKIVFPLAFFLSTNIISAQTFPDRTILKSTTGQKYIVVGNALFRLNDNSGISINPGNITAITPLAIRDFKTIPKDTTLLREVNSNETYIMNIGRRCMVPQKLLLLTYAEPYVNIVPRGSLNIIPIGNRLPDFDKLSHNEFDTLQKVMAYNFKIKYNKLREADFKIGGAASLKRLDEIDIRRLKKINQLMTAKFGSDPKFGAATYAPASSSIDVSAAGDTSSTQPTGDLGVIRQPLQPQPSLRGFADLHCHMFANLAFGGRYYVGSPYGRLDSVLAPCSASGVIIEYARAEAFIVAYLACNAACDLALFLVPGGAVLCLAACIPTATYAAAQAVNLLVKEPHGVDGSKDFIGQMMRNHYQYASRNSGDIPWAIPGLIVGSPVYHNGEGYPDFGGWPQWDDFNHQRAHINFLRRSHNGGMRLIVMMAVENKLFYSKLNSVGETDGKPYDEMSGIYKQIDEAKKMEQYVAANEGGWLEIVYTPGDAEKAIKAGKLAMVLGTENGQFINNPSDYKTIKSNLQKLYDAGVRQVFTIHEDDNNFGGAAYFADRIQDISITNPLGIADIPSVEPAPQYKAATSGRRNAQGLTPQGVFLQQSLMALGMIYDIDHMSEYTKDSTLGLAENANYPGLVASHCGFFDINDLHQLHEGQLTKSQLTRLDSLGGVIGLIVNQGVFKDDVHPYPKVYPRIRYTCGGSTETFAQAYSYALVNFKDSLNNTRGIAFGSDITPIPLVGPRFPCPGTGTTLIPRLKYPFRSLFDGKQINKSVIGNRTYDFNEDGMGHIGMYPDMIADLQTIGFLPAELEPIYKSAEEYVTMWKKADAIKLNGYINFLSNPCRPDLFFYDVDGPSRVVYILHEGVKSIVQNAGRNNIITLPHEVVQALPTLGKADVGYKLIKHISGSQSKVIIYAKSCSGTSLNGKIIDDQGNNLGNTNTEIIINTNCITRLPTTTDHPTPTPDVPISGINCKSFDCSNNNVIVQINGYINSTMSINLSGTECQ